MSQNLTQYPWAPHLYTDLDFRDCGPDLLVLWKHHIQGDSLSDDREGLAVYKAIVHGLQGYWQANGFEQPPQTEVLQWESETFDLYHALSESLSNGTCKNQVCPILGWEGNSDIAGLGMLSAYFTQAVLITVYIPSLLSVRFDWLSDRKSTVSLIGRTLLAVQHSTPSFLNASIVFSIAMLSASLVSFANHDVLTLSTLAIMLLMPFGSVLPVTLLQLAASDTLRRHRGRLLSWILMAALMIVLLITALILNITNITTEDKDIKQVNWETFCLGRGNVYNFFWFSLGLAGLLILGIVCFVIGSFSASLQRQSAASWSRRVWWITLVTAFIAMWLCLGWFVLLQMQRNDMAGKDNKDTKWSFGQILAVATWVPVIIEFVYIWWETPVKALSGQLMDPYEVKEVLKKNEGFGSLRRRQTV